MDKKKYNTLWPLAIFLLLAANVSVAVGTMIVANMNGGVEVVPDYYQKAVAWDSLSANQNATKVWNIEQGELSDSNALILKITDHKGTPVPNLNVQIMIQAEHATEHDQPEILTATPGLNAGEYIVESSKRSEMDGNVINVTVADGQSTFSDRIQLEIE